MKNAMDIKNALEPARKKRKLENQENDSNNFEKAQEAEEDEESKNKKILEKQPKLVTGGILREYQLHGLQWMVYYFPLKSPSLPPSLPPPFSLTFFLRSLPSSFDRLPFLKMA